MIKIINIGWYHPSNANWNYNIWLVIDGEEARLYKETFGGHHRMMDRMKKEGKEIKEIYGVMFNGYYKGREVAKMPDIEEYTTKK